MIWPVLGLSLLAFASTGAALGAAMGLTGFVILQFFAGGATNQGIFAVWDIMNNSTFSAIPMFMLLGDLLVLSGLSQQIYNAIAPFFQRVPGRLIHSNILVTLLFGAVCGSSAATSAAVGTVAYPELVKRNYSPALAAASLASGGALGLLIPPSLTLLIFGAWQEVSVGKLFLAGIFPALMIAVLFMCYIVVDGWRRPELMPAPAEMVPMREAVKGLVKLWPLIVLLGSVLGTIYTGLATVTEAAGFGVAATVVLGLVVGELTPKKIFQATITSTVGFGALSFILIGAAILSQAFTITGLPQQLAGVVTGMELSAFSIFIVVVIFYLIMGIFFDGLALMLTTVPFIYPMMLAAGYDPVWIGIFVVIMIEIGLLTPPVGVNLFVMLAITKKTVSMGALGRECLPYWILMMVGAVIIAVFPSIVLFLPRLI